MSAERCRDIAHVSAVQLRTQVPDQTIDFFVRLMGMSEVARDGTGVYLRTWEDYERFTVCVIDAPGAGVGRTWMRAASPGALARRVAAGTGSSWPTPAPGWCWPRTGGRFPGRARSGPGARRGG
jgi:catechol 2,3-dioxygenase